MFNLIKNELYKLFHKKSTFIVLIITILYTILVNVVYKIDNNNYDYYESIEWMEKELTFLEQNSGNIEDIIYYKTEIDVQKLAQKYDSNAWQQDRIFSEYYEVINSYYNAVYFNDSKEIIDRYKEQINELEKIFETNNWRYFAEKELAESELSLKALNSELKITASEKRKIEIKKDIEIKEVIIRLIKYRLDNNIEYNSGFISDAIDENTYLVYDMVNHKYESDIKEKSHFENSIKNYYENEYILENKVDTNNTHSLRGVLVNLFSEFEFLILVFVIMIAGGMVSDEFNKGTIKSLLTTPNTRGKILLSKFLTVLIMIPFIAVFILLIEMLIGGITFGFSSLSVPVVNYIVSENTLSIMNVFSYLGLIFVTKLPYLILLATLAFSLSTILVSTAFSIAITFCGYIGAQLINALASTYKIKFLNYFVTTNWDLSYYIFGGKSPYGISLIQSLLVCFIYFIIMLIVSFIIFKKRNIKNI